MERPFVVSGNPNGTILSGNPYVSNETSNIQHVTQRVASTVDIAEVNDETEQYQASGEQYKRQDNERPMTEQNFCGFKVEKPKMPSFSGDVQENAIFRSDFKHAIEARYTKRVAITMLRKCLNDKPLELIK